MTQNQPEMSLRGLSGQSVQTDWNVVLAIPSFNVLKISDNERNQISRHDWSSRVLDQLLVAVRWLLFDDVHVRKCSQLSINL